MATKTLYLISKTESESGWGCRPDGLEMFENSSDMESRISVISEEIKKYPNEFTFVDSKAIVEIDSREFSKLKKINPNLNFWKVGERDITYLKKVCPSFKIIMSERM